jgi:RecA-family ATPase
VREARKASLDADDKDPDARILKFMQSNYGPKGKPMRLRWRNGLFVPDDGKALYSAQVNAEIKFMQMLDAYTEQKRIVSASLGGNYAPTIFSRDVSCRGFSMAILRDAMNALFAKGEIKVETYGPRSRQVSRIVRG